MRRITLLSSLLLLACSSAAGQAPPDVLADLPSVDGAASAGCGDGLCSEGEDCLGCPVDCACSCGDGLCTAGEYCALCPEDCDCDAPAATPPMGWNSWNKFACDVSAELITEMAEAMVASGLRDVGYRYVNVDDCWQVERGEDGVIVADPERFPAGMAALADAVHALGLDFGLYTDVGPMTCQERPGSYGYEAVDAATYADWGVDYVKVTGASTTGSSPTRSTPSSARPSRAPAGPSSTASATGAWTRPGSGVPGPATCGARPATSATSGPA